MNKLITVTALALYGLMISVFYIVAYEYDYNSRPHIKIQQRIGAGTVKGKLIRYENCNGSELLIPYKVGTLEKLKAGKIKAFLHFTGDKCLLCKYEWAKVNKKKLGEAALKNGYVLYEYNIDKDWSKVLKELAPHGVFSVPGYVFINDEGKVTTLESIDGEDSIIKKMEESK